MLGRVGTNPGYLVPLLAYTRRRQRQIMDSPHFGVLQGLKGGSQTVRDLLAALETEGYVEEVERGRNGGTYTYPAPTAKGLQRLKGGQLFRGEDED